MVTNVTNVIKDSARKHGFTDETIAHAYSNAIIVHFLDGYQILIGPTPSGELLEIGVNQDGDIFHAMKARLKFLRKGWMK
ncbi:hypothetical protein [Varibaculum cambriense]|uniref:hypothetical protein n=1 Tax=Varibaculum cambriense TaxID=184870 RepID=UPI002151D640|nr:hypothetical protein [Varibaculum cambriense]WIK88218.1 hypothetical protein CYK25_008510 [Varibaculum cambriense]